MSQPELDMPIEPKTISVAFVIPEKRQFISPGMGESRLFTRTFSPEAQFTIRGGTRRQLTTEELAHTISQDNAYDLPPVSTYKGLGSIEDIRGFAVRAASGNSVNKLPRFAVRVFEFDDVEAAASHNKAYISDRDLEFLLRAFASGVRRQTQPIPVMSTDEHAPLAE